MSLWARIKEVWAAWRDPLDVFDDDYPDSHPFTDPIPLDADCPDEQPERGALPSHPDLEADLDG